MGWFRRKRPENDTSEAEQTAETGPVDAGPSDDSHLPIAVASAPALARTERALLMLAAQSAQIQASVVHLEQRVDSLSSALMGQLERPSSDELLAARAHSAKVAAELSRLEVNVAARLDAVRAEMRSLAGEEPEEIDLRTLRPVDTGWSLPAG